MLLVPYHIICSSHDVIIMSSVPSPCTQTTYLFVDLLMKPHMYNSRDIYKSPWIDRTVLRLSICELYRAGQFPFPSKHLLQPSSLSPFTCLPFASLSQRFSLSLPLSSLHCTPLPWLCCPETSPSAPKGTISRFLTLGQSVIGAHHDKCLQSLNTSSLPKPTVSPS